MPGHLKKFYDEYHADPKQLTGSNKPRELRPITYHQKVFADKFIETNNAALSYRHAYPGTDKALSRKLGHRCLKKPHVAKYILDRREAILEKTDITFEKNLALLWRQAKASLGDFMDIDPETGQVEFDFDKATPDQIACLSEVQIVENEFTHQDGTVEVRKRVTGKIRDPLKAISMINKMMGFEAPKKTEVNVTVATLAERMALAEKRVQANVVDAEFEEVKK